MDGPPDPARRIALDGEAPPPRATGAALSRSGLACGAIAGLVGIVSTFLQLVDDLGGPAFEGIKAEGFTYWDASGRWKVVAAVLLVALLVAATFGLARARRRAELAVALLGAVVFGAFGRYLLELSSVDGPGAIGLAIASALALVSACTLVWAARDRIFGPGPAAATAPAGWYPGSGEDGVAHWDGAAWSADEPERPVP